MCWHNYSNTFDAVHWDRLTHKHLIHFTTTTKLFHFGPSYDCMCCLLRKVSLSKETVQSFQVRLKLGSSWTHTDRSVYFQLIYNTMCSQTTLHSKVQNKQRVETGFRSIFWHRVLWNQSCACWYICGFSRTTETWNHHSTNPYYRMNIKHMLMR